MSWVWTFQEIIADYILKYYSVHELDMQYIMHLFCNKNLLNIYIAWAVSFERLQVSLSLARHFLTYLRSLWNTSFHVFLDLLLGKRPLILNVLHLLDQALSSLLSRRPNYYNLLSCRLSFTLFKFSPGVSPSTKTLLGLSLHSHLTLFASSFFHWKKSKFHIAWRCVPMRNTVCHSLVRENLHWLTKTLDRRTYSIHTWSLLYDWKLNPLYLLLCHHDKVFPQFQKIGHLILCLQTLYYVSVKLSTP